MLEYGTGFATITSRVTGANSSEDRVVVVITGAMSTDDQGIAGSIGPGTQVYTAEELATMLQESNARVMALEDTLRQQQTVASGNTGGLANEQAAPLSTAAIKLLSKPDAYEGGRDPAVLEHWKYQIRFLLSYKERRPFIN